MIWQINNIVLCKYCTCTNGVRTSIQITEEKKAKKARANSLSNFDEAVFC